jgi:methionyl aminopeptidase
MAVTAPKDVDLAAAAAEAVVEVHRRLVGFVRPGLTLAAIDAFVGQALADLGCRSAFLGYRARGHPAFPSHACLSPNACVVHGTHDLTPRPLERGDLLSIDIGVRREGWIGDAAWTYGVGGLSDEAMALLRCGREALRRGIAALQPGAMLLDWAKAVQSEVEQRHRYCLVRGLGGHGYGRELHSAPFVSNAVPGYPGEWPDAWIRLKPGMLLAVEPMVAAGTTEIRSEGRNWPIFTADGSLSVHFEANVLVTAEGPRNLTAGLFDLPEIVGGDA